MNIEQQLANAVRTAVFEYLPQMQVYPFQLDQKEFFTLRECCLYLGREATYVSTLQGKIKSGALRAKRDGREWMVRRSDLVSWIETWGAT